MSLPSLVVLKFGGSVLDGGQAIPLAVREISGHLQKQERVIAVVSAFKNHTDALEKRAQHLCERPAPDAYAFYVGLGELYAAGELTLGLQGSGIPATIRTPWDVWLFSGGAPLNAVPVALSRHRFFDAFRNHRVVVFPGFVGRGGDGRPHLLGRGGSDLTAIFLAAELGADRCVLLKDTAGIFEWDPARDGSPPRRYSKLSWEDAIVLGSPVLKPAHVEYARSRRVTIEVTAPGTSYSTIVGDDASQFAAQREPEHPKPGHRE
ncbi:MAG TPA: hypothetical protein VFH88_12800 [Candidatus Krumholzibacteria bacterium]|nr:hypothetical protein [Candidatus Krumholzibacteria bacterium]